MDDFKLAKSLASGEIDWHCPRMELRRCPSYHETVMTGCGVIRSNKRGDLSFRLSGEVPHPFPRVLRNEQPPGTMYAIDEHVMLVAIDAQGREWRSNPLLIHIEHPGEMLHGHLSRRLHSLMHCRKRPMNDASTVRMNLPQQSQVPLDFHTTGERKAGAKVIRKQWAIDHHARRLGDAEVTFRKEDGGWLSVLARQDSPLMPDWPGLLCHALSFALSSDVHPAVIVREFNESEHVGLFAGPFLRFQSHMPRPLNGLDPASAEAFWSSVERFFLFAWERRLTPLPFLTELQAIRGGATSSIPTASLTLAIGIEALAKELLPEVKAAGWNEKEKAEIVAYLEQWTWRQTYEGPRARMAELQGGSSCGGPTVCVGEQCRCLALVG
jgi:hypothetical protein